MRPVAVLSVLVNAKGVRGTNAQLRMVQGQLVATGSAGSRMGSQVAKGAKIAAAGAAGLAVATGALAIDFEKSMRNVNSIAQLPEKQLKRLEKRVLRLAGKSAQAPKTLAEGLYDLVSSGFDADESMRILAKSAKAATAGLTTTEVSTKAVAAVLNAYKRPARDAGRVSDELFRIVDRGVITFEDLAQNIGDVLPFAQSLRVPLQDVGAAVATMTKAGVSAPESMTRIKGAMVALLKPSEDMTKALDRLGVQTGDELIRKTGSFQGALQALSRTTGGSKEAMAKLFPDIRGLGGALLLTGKNAQGAAKDLKGLRDSSGATDRALSQQSKSVAFQWQQAKAQAQAFGIELGQKLLPQISKVFKILSDPKLSGEEKFERISAMLEDALTKGVDAAADVAPKIAATLARGFVTWWADANPLAKILGAAAIIRLVGGQGALTATGARLGHWLGAGVAASASTTIAGGGAGGAAGGLLAATRAKLLPIAGRLGVVGLGVALADKAITDFSNRAAERSGDLFAALKAKGDPSAILGVGIEDVFGKSDTTKNAENIVKTLERIRGKNNGISSATAAQVREMARFLDLTSQQKDALETLLSRGEDRFWAVRRAINGVTRSVGLLRDGLVFSVRDMRKETETNLHKIVSVIGADTARGRKLIAANFQAGLDSIQRFVQKGKLTTGQGVKEIARLMAAHSKAGVDGMGGNLDRLRSMISRTMRRGGQITAAGMGLIKDLFVKELRLYGLSPKEALAGANVRTGEVPGGRRRQDFQRGGPINMGKPTGDSVPALLERGEYVLNRKAVATVGREQLDAINFGAARRFQTGGFTGPHGSGAGFTPLANFLFKKYGLQVTSGKDDHSTYTINGNVSDHSTGQAIDVSNSSAPTPQMDAAHTFMRNKLGVGGSWVENYSGGALKQMLYRTMIGGNHFNHIHVALQKLFAFSAERVSKLIGGGGGGAMGQIARTIIKGPDSPLKSILQATLDKTRAAANERLEGLAGSLLPGAMGSGGGSHKDVTGNGAELMKRISQQRGWNFADWWEVDRRETGHGADLLNEGSGAALRGQFMPGITQGHYGPGSAPWMNPTMDQQIWAMARYIKERYGNPTAARIFHDSHNWYAEGGLVGMVGDSLGKGTADAGLSGMLGGRLRANNVIGRSSADGVDALQGMLGKRFHEYIFDLGTNDGSPAAVAASLRRADRMTGNRPLLAMVLKGPNKGALDGVGSNDVHHVRWPGGLGSDGLHPTDYGKRANALAAAAKRFAPKPKKRDRKAPRGTRRRKVETGGRVPSMEALNRAINIVGGLNPDGKPFSKDERSNALHNLLDGVKAVGLRPQVAKNIAAFQEQADIAADMAGRAGALTFEPTDANGNPLLDAERRPITEWGVVGGKNEIQWLNEQLGALFGLRNAIVRAEEALTKKREALGSLVEHARKRHHEIAQAIREAGNRKRRLEKEVEEGRERLQKLREKPRQNAAKIKALRAEIVGKADQVEKIERIQGGRVRARDALNNRIIPALTEKQGSLNTRRGEVLTSLNEVQGLGSPMGVLGALPPVGVLGGQIFDVQMQLKELGAPKAAVTDSSSDAGDGESAELLRELLREANQRTAVSEAQFKVLRDTRLPFVPEFPFMGAFAKGGVALVGEDGPELAHMPSGTRIHSAADTQTMLAPSFQVIINGDIVNTPPGKQPVEVVSDQHLDAAVERVTRRQARHAGRRLPGGGGGLQT